MNCFRCNKAIPRAKEISAGYGADKEGNPMCYTCCGVVDKEYMLVHGRHSGLYLSRNSSNDGYEVGNWPGSIKFKVGVVKKSWHNFAGKDGRIDFWFSGPDGKTWHGVCIGDMQLCRVKRNKS